MKVAYKVVDIEGKGKGIVANEDIKKGELVWDVTTSLHHLFYSVENAKSIVSDVEYIRVLEVGVGHATIPNQILYLYDDSQYFNHSDCPNCGRLDDNNENALFSLSLYALRDIDKGEELIENYEKYTFPLWFLDELKKHNLLPSYCNLVQQNPQNM